MQPKDLLRYGAVLAIGLVIGFFAGREYLKYEIAEAFSSAAASISKGFSGGTTSSVDQGTPAPPAAPTEPSPIAVVLTKKDFRQADYSAGYGDAVTFSLSLHNLTNKDIRAFDGDVTFTDLLGNEIISSKLAINDPIKAGTTVSWDGELNYNQFMDAHQRFRAADMQNIKTVFHPHKVLYSDGSEKTFQ